MVTRGVRIAVGTSVFAALVAFGGPLGAAPESVQKQCGDEWAAAKKAGKVAAGQAWPGFLSECRKRHANDAAAAPANPAAPATPAAAAPALAPVAPAAPAKTATPAAPAKTAAPAAPAKTDTPKAAAGDINDTCKSEYSAGKASGTVPKGTNYFKYLSECKKRHAGDAAPATTTAAPAAPPASPKPTAAAPTPAPKPTAAAPTTTKPTSAGREAFIERERTCGAKWRTIKGTAALPAGITTWPKYLSYCNTRLKANQPI